MAFVHNISFADKKRPLLTLDCSSEEISNLKGSVDNLLVMPGSELNVESRVSMRGKNDSTVYLLIPKEYRKDITQSRSAKCFRIDTDTEIVMVYKIPKSKK